MGVYKRIICDYIFNDSSYSLISDFGTDEADNGYYIYDEKESLQKIDAKKVIDILSDPNFILSKSAVWIHYVYNGPVYIFERLVADRWAAETMATSKKKALNNIRYQFAKQNGWGANTKIILDENLLIEK